jgi:MFS family permease
LSRVRARSPTLVFLVGKLGPSRRNVFQLAGLFAADAAGGGLITATFLAYYFTTRYSASSRSLGFLFFGVSLLQAASVLVAPRMARRFGLIWTMVGTHLPSNVLLIAIAFAPNLKVAFLLRLARSFLSQMDVPTRAAMVMKVVTPEEPNPAAAITMPPDTQFDHLDRWLRPLFNILPWAHQWLWQGQ